MILPKKKSLNDLQDIYKLERIPIAELLDKKFLDSSAQRELADYLQEAENETKKIRLIYEEQWDNEMGFTKETEEIIESMVEKIDVIHAKVIKFLRNKK